MPSTIFSGGRASLGLIVPLGEGREAALLADYSSRAPVGEELFSDGPHPGTGVFEIGDPGLDHGQRPHTSIVKDLAPQPGRMIETGLRMRF